MTIKDLWSFINKNDYTKELTTDTDYKYKMVNDVLYIAFQGSISFKDWVYNFKFFKKPYKNMKQIWFAHKGYIKKYKSVESKIINLIINIKLQMQLSKIIISGHSQGGALAILCHESIWFKFPEYRDKLQTITFGSPRVIGLVSSLKIKERFKNVIRYEQFWDIVIRIPFSFLLYKHIGKRKRIGNRWYQPNFKFLYTHMHYKKYLD